MSTRLGQTGRELARVNPWWRGEGWTKTDTDLRTVAESGLNYRNPGLDGLVGGGLYLLRGPRRVGKTVGVKQTIAALLEEGVPPLAIVRVAADGWEAGDLRTVVSNVALPPVPAGHHRWWFIDEVSAVKGDWATQIKWLRDNDPAFSDATVVLTGSSASSLTAAAGVLAGRRGRIDDVDRTLLPMGARTFCQILQPELAALPRLAVGELHTRGARQAYEAALPWLDDLVRLWELYLLYGGFPASVAAAFGAQPVPGWFVNDIFHVIFEDAFASSSLNESQTASFVARLWESITSPANMATIAADVGISHDVVARHIAYLRDAYLLWACPQKAEKDWVARERAQDKLYAIDPLVARLAHLRNLARPDVDTTALAEMQIGMALRRSVAASGRAWASEESVFHLRTPNRKEIDFVSEALCGIAVESKYVETGKWRSEAATVEASGFTGILTTRNVLDCADPDSAWAVPSAVLAALVDT